MSTQISPNALNLPGVLSVGLALGCSLGWAGTVLRQRQDRKTYARQLHEAWQAAWTDPLTGLPNRAALTTRLGELADFGGWCLAMVDLDDFKAVNDTLGHNIGDQVLAATARRLAAVLPGEMVARLGGDEFAVILPAPVKRALSMLQRAVGAVGRPQQDHGLQLRTGCSAGVAEHTTGLATAELMRRADMALYQAKHIRGHALAWTPSPGTIYASRTSRWRTAL